MIELSDNQKPEAIHKSELHDKHFGERKKIKIPVPDFTEIDPAEFKKFTVTEVIMILITIGLLILAVIQYINFMPEK